MEDGLLPPRHPHHLPPRPIVDVICHGEGGDGGDRLSDETSLTFIGGRGGAMKGRGLDRVFFFSVSPTGPTA